MSIQLSDESRAIVQREYSRLRTEIKYNLYAAGEAVEVTFPTVCPRPEAIQELADLKSRLAALLHGLPLEWVE